MVRVVTADELRPVLTTLEGLEWPVSVERIPEVHKALGWEPVVSSYANTTLPVSLRLASFGKIQDHISEVMFRVSDTFDEEDASTATQIREVFPDAVAAVAAVLGRQPDSESWARPGVRWDLDGGRQLNLLRMDDTIALQYWSKEYADLERLSVRAAVT